MEEDGVVGDLAQIADVVIREEQRSLPRNSILLIWYPRLDQSPRADLDASFAVQAKVTDADFLYLLLAQAAKSVGDRVKVMDDPDETFD